MKKLKTWIDKNGYNIELYEDERLIDWRCGLTKKGFERYKKAFEKLLHRG